MELKYNTTGHPTNLSGLSVESLVQFYLKNTLRPKESVKVVQEIHNYYARKLHIPSVLVERTYFEDDACAAFYVSSLDISNNAKIYVANGLEVAFGALSVFSSIIHETKHAQQMYDLHKFFERGVVPKDNYGKAQLLFKLFLITQDSACSQCPYNCMLSEIDAFVFEIEESKKLAQKHPVFNSWRSFVERNNQVLDF